MTERCDNCRFWHPWHEVMLADDAPQMIGHCVVLVPIPGFEPRPVAQGLTGGDFHCNGYKRQEFVR